MTSSKSATGKNPTALAMIICDHVWRDPCEGKSTIIGTFTTLNADSFPFRHPVMAIYLALTNGHGDVPLKLRLVDAAELFPPVFELTTTMRFPSPIDLVETGFELPGPVFPRPGEHRLQLFANDEPLIERRLLLKIRLIRNQPHS